MYSPGPRFPISKPYYNTSHDTLPGGGDSRFFFTLVPICRSMQHPFSDFFFFDDSNLLQCKLWYITVYDDVSSFALAQDHIQQ